MALHFNKQLSGSLLSCFCSHSRVLSSLVQWRLMSGTGNGSSRSSESPGPGRPRSGSDKEKSILQLFGSDYNLADNVSRFLNSLDISIAGLKGFVKSSRQENLVLNQAYLPDRPRVLGPDLAAAHFVAFRGGRIRFRGVDGWFARLDDGGVGFPRVRDPNFIVEALDCSKMDIIYEGFQNMSNLVSLKYLNLDDCPHIDDWCLDRIAGEYGNSLEILSIRNCTSVTENGIGALSKLHKLKTLRLSGLPRANNLPLVCLLLEDILPDLRVQGVEYISNPADLKTLE